MIFRVSNEQALLGSVFLFGTVGCTGVLPWRSAIVAFIVQHRPGGLGGGTFQGLLQDIVRLSSEEPESMNEGPRKHLFEI